MCFELTANDGSKDIVYCIYITVLVLAKQTSSLSLNYVNRTKHADLNFSSNFDSFYFPAGHFCMLQIFFDKKQKVSLRLKVIRGVYGIFPIEHTGSPFRQSCGQSSLSKSEDNQQ
jgi:hypothetical protein